MTIDGDDSASVRQRSTSATIPSMQRSASSLETLPTSVIDSSRLRAITGSITSRSKLPCVPANVIAVSLPITWAATITVASGSTGFTLPGMIDEPGCRSGSEISPMPGARPGTHPAKVVGDLHQRHGNGAQRPGRLDKGILGRLRLEVVAGLREREPGVLGDQRDHPRGETRRAC